MYSLHACNLADTLRTKSQDHERLISFWLGRSIPSMGGTRPLRLPIGVRCPAMYLRRRPAVPPIACQSLIGDAGNALVQVAAITIIFVGSWHKALYKITVKLRKIGLAVEGRSAASGLGQPPKKDSVSTTKAFRCLSQAWCFSFKRAPGARRRMPGFRSAGLAVLRPVPKLRAGPCCFQLPGLSKGAAPSGTGRLSSGATSSLSPRDS